MRRAASGRPFFYLCDCIAPVNFTYLDTLNPETTWGFRIKTVCNTERTISPFSDWYCFATVALRKG